ncbi:MerR family transcriptional regulator [Moorena sp. SIO4G3]|uniref:MerR family transcriptional regulator n=1 Tax=Moorena sp. SIO4G3 TaxID=2607821 RepID=UPI0025DF385A|nr:MerR family transcriptional regulator [Moorena sp. SIO4G3]
MALIPFRKAVELTGLSKNTLRKYADNGTIKWERTPRGYRLFDTESLLTFRPTNTATPTTLCYS